MKLHALFFGFFNLVLDRGHLIHRAAVHDRYVASRAAGTPGDIHRGVTASHDDYRRGPDAPSPLR